MDTTQPAGEDLVKHFPNAKEDSHTLAYRFNETGEGLCYYSSGRVAMAVSNVGDHQKRFYVYDDDKDKTMLCSLNELAVGFAINNTRKHSNRGARLVLTKGGGVYSNGEGTIQNEWKWDRKAQNAGVIPASGIVMPLNKNFKLAFEDRFMISITYEVEGIIRHFDCGLKLKRMDSYLDTATRNNLGRLEITSSDYRTLNQRQTDFALSMTALRNKNNPKSENLSSMVNAIVGDLESHFDTYDSDKRSLPSLHLHAAKVDAFNTTCSELPKIKRTDTDIHFEGGYSSALYLDSKSASTYKFSAKDTARPILLKPDGTWKSDVEIRLALMTLEHPPLPKPTHIKRSNGHYSYNHNARPIKKRVGETLRSASTVKEKGELSEMLKGRLGDMGSFIDSLKNR
ncbi:hypothetical protein TrVE_jg6093 [Triparma verrucosa]|uniref:FAM194 C-terminal domain-containing protein n=1 Tax=Triparma verrucosa TaxID=1606542 RepID=A0A9W7F394_9STRA|nr:hypothetical protein TrVE_jg6093 [Triparma verrucosa]|mmetsp:Transcript_8294/g.15082  ORF Transcript_8294/g.15082 Transcript_8294/m.15082 type:complete len:398 (-) Transcript_8294:48-1241(-)